MIGKFAVLGVCAALLAAGPASAARLELLCQSPDGQARTDWSDVGPSEEQGKWSEDSLDLILRFRADTETGELDLNLRAPSKTDWQPYVADGSYAEISAVRGNPVAVFQIVIRGDDGLSETLTFTGVQNKRARMALTRSSIIGASSVVSLLAGSCRVSSWRN